MVYSPINLSFKYIVCGNAKENGKFVQPLPQSRKWLLCEKETINFSIIGIFEEKYGWSCSLIWWYCTYIRFAKTFLLTEISKHYFGMKDLLLTRFSRNTDRTAFYRRLWINWNELSLIVSRSDTIFCEHWMMVHFVCCTRIVGENYPWWISFVMRIIQNI